MNDDALDAAARALAGKLTGMLTRIPDDRAYYDPQPGVDVEGGCPLCAYAETAGSWPTSHRGTHCEGCHRSWSSKVEVHCPRCHLHFAADSTADLHDAHCDPDTDLTLRRLRSARRGDGTPVLALRHRKDGFVFVRWTRESGDKPW